MSETTEIFDRLADYSNAGSQARAKEIIRDVDARMLANAIADDEPACVQFGFLQAYKQSRAAHAAAEAQEVAARERFNAAKKRFDQAKK